MTILKIKYVLTFINSKILPSKFVSYYFALCMRIAFKNKFTILLALFFTMLGNLYANVTTDATTILNVKEQISSTTLNTNLGLPVIEQHSHFAAELTEADEEEVTESVASEKISKDNGNFKVAFFYAQNFGSFYPEPTQTHTLAHFILQNVAKIYIKYQVLLI